MFAHLLCLAYGRESLVHNQHKIPADICDFAFEPVKHQQSRMSIKKQMLLMVFD